jgi:hypothetical protein
MGQFVSRVHNRQDDKLYNILPIGDMPTVVFGRVIRPNSVPGMQYYFQDGMVKYKDEEHDVGYSYVKPYPINENEMVWGIACIFTVPENLDFSKMNDVEYVKQFVRKARNLNANTTSQNFIIRDGNIICIRKLTIDSYNVISRTRRYKKQHQRSYKETFWSYVERGKKIMRNKKHLVKLIGLSSKNNLSHSFLNKIKTNNRGCGLRNTITIIPIVSRCPRRKSIYHYKYRAMKNNINSTDKKNWITYYRIY